MKKRILILGGQGYLGGNIAGSFSKKYDVVAISRQKVSLNYPSNVRVIEGNYLLKDFISELSPIFAIVHSGSNLHPRTILPDEDYQKNLFLEVELLKTLSVQARLGNLNKVIYLSSAGEVYGKQKQALHSENDKLKPISQYGKFKAHLEEEYTEQLKGLCQLFIARVSNPYGKPGKVLSDRNFLNRSISLALRGQDIEIWGSGTVKRDFLYIDDFIAAILAMIENDTLVSEVFNIGFGSSFSLAEVVQQILKLIPSVTARHANQCFSPQISDNLIDISKAKQILSWEPTVDLEKGVAKVIKFMRST